MTTTRCPTCGTSYAANSRFCTKDGTRLVTADAQSAAAQGQAGSGPSTPKAGQPVSPEPTGFRRTPATPQRRLDDVSKMAGEVLDGRYRIERKVGEGGMSFVYRATDSTNSEVVAIKVLSPKLAHDPKAMMRLRREAEMGARLVHPNICHIRALGQTEFGLVYIVMPFVEGELLCDRTIRLGQLSLEDTVRFVRDIAVGLQLAHQLGIIHRDLKPENVMLCPAPEGGERAVVMDFGLAKERRVAPEVEKLTATGIVLGTPEFMSPEQLRGKVVDARTDIYALALMTFEMLTGQLPFAGRTPQDIMVARLRHEPLPLRKVRPDLDFAPSVERVLLKAMEREASERYQTAPEFALALASAASGTLGEDPDRGVFGKLLRW